jgi:prolyl-tRNA synthetase
MRLSRYFLPILKENPREAEIVSHRLMLRAGMIRQQAAGLLLLAAARQARARQGLPIIREEQDRAGALEILMPTIQSADLWRESGRYDDYGKEMLRIKDRQERDMLYGPTNEEMVTEIFRSYVKSYKDLPLNLYHIQWKFRDEVRPRFGVMRGREFLMKDAYSFDLTYEGARAAYNRMFVAYLRTFTRLGLKAIPMRADTGPIGGDLSHEFIILADTGESQVFCHKRLPRSCRCPARTTSPTTPRSAASSSSGRRPTPRPTRCMTRRPGTSISESEPPFGARHRGRPYLPLRRQSIRSRWAPRCTGPDGKEHFVSMGSYGIGPTRLIARSSRRATTRTASSGRNRRAVRCGHDQHEGRRCRLRQASARHSTPRSGGRARRALR